MQPQITSNLSALTIYSWFFGDLICKQLEWTFFTLKMAFKFIFFGDISKLKNCSSKIVKCHKIYFLASWRNLTVKIMSLILSDTFCQIWILWCTKFSTSWKWKRMIRTMSIHTLNLKNIKTLFYNFIYIYLRYSNLLTFSALISWF